MARLVDGEMQVDVGVGLVVGIGLGVGGVDAREAAAQALAVDGIRPARGERRGHALQHGAQLQVVVHDLIGPLGHQLDQRIGDAGGERRDRPAPAGLGHEQALVLEHLHPLAQGRARHVQPRRHLAFGQERLAGAQRSLENQVLQVTRRAFRRRSAFDSFLAHPRILYGRQNVQGFGHPDPGLQDYLRPPRR